MRRRIPLLLVVALAALLPWSMSAAADAGVRIKVTQVDVSGFPQVRIVASVTDAQDRPLRGLTAADFELREDGRAQAATVELASQTSPIALALVLDTSGSMAGRPIADAKSAMSTLIRSLGPSDQATVITFDSTVHVERPLTGDKAALIAATSAAAAMGNTAIYDALATATVELGKARAEARRAIVLLTDGVDNSSRANPVLVLNDLAATSLPVHVIGLGADLDRAALSRIAAAVPGGQLLEAPTSERLAAIYDGLGTQLLTQYTATYRSAATVPDGTALAAEVRVRQGGAVIATAPVSIVVPAGRGVRVQTPAATVAPKPTAAPTNAPETGGSRVSRQASALIALLGTATVLLLLLWVSEVASTFPGRQRRRLETFVRGLSITTSHDKRRSIVQRVLVPVIRSAGRPLERITPTGVVAATRERLQAAGEPLGLGASEFIGVRAGVAMIGAIAGIAIATALAQDAGAAPFGALGGIFAGFAAPGIAIDRVGAARKDRIRRALPSALDMLALSTEAGLSFDGAIGQVARRWETPLSEEFRRLLVEFQMGRDRREALRELGERTGVLELMRFASAVTQADSLGVPLSRVLHDQSAEIRNRQRQRAEESARKAPVKMLFPMVIFIFPALFVVILGPAVPRLLDALQSFN